MFDQISNLFNKTFETPIAKVASNNINLTTLIYLGLVILGSYLFYIFLDFLFAIQVNRKVLRKSQSKMLLQLCEYVIIIATFIYILSVLGFSVKYLFVGSTALLVGLGFGLQQLFLDIIAGVILLIDRNINLGDVVRIDNPSTMNGRILHIGLRATTLETVDNEIMVVPNNKILSSGVRSLMRSRGAARFRVQTRIGYNVDIELAKRLMVEALEKDNRIDRSPAPNVILRDFSENGLVLELRFWMSELFNSENILSDVRYNILKKFNENNVKIPYLYVEDYTA